MYCQDLTPVKKEVNSVEGDTVSLTCNYSKTAVAGDYFYWYRQDIGKPPQFLLYIPVIGDVFKTDPLNNRSSANLNEGKNHLNLSISSAEVTDSALYYCALRPTVTETPGTLHKNLPRSITGTEAWNNPSTVVVPPSAIIYNKLRGGGGYSVQGRYYTGYRNRLMYIYAGIQYIYE